MPFFRRKKKEDVLDLTKQFNRQQERAREIQQKMNSSQSSQMSSAQSSSDSNDASGLGFFGAIAQTASQTSNETSGYVDVSGSSANPDERRRKLAKRLMDMTEKIEELSNQIYHLQQRLEVLERKAGVGGGF